MNDPFNSRVPSEVVIGLVSGSGSHGDYHVSPYRFVTKKVNYVQVTLDGQDMGDGPIQTKYMSSPEDSQYLEAYKSLCGINGSQNENPLTRLQFTDGYCFYRFVTDHDESSANDDIVPLRRMGNVRVSIRFDEMLDEAMTVIMFARFPAGFKIDKNRSVYEM